MKNLVIDMDRHVIEPYGIWEEYLHDDYKMYAPTLIKRPVMDEAIRTKMEGKKYFPPQLQVAGNYLLNIPDTLLYAWSNRSKKVYSEWKNGEDPNAQLRSMEKIGADISLMMPTYAGYLAVNDNLSPDVCAAFAAAYNDWLYDYCKVDPEKLWGTGLISKYIAELMIEELEKSLDRGWNQVVMRPNPVKDPNAPDKIITLGDKRYWPFWKKCEDNNVVVVLHESTYAQATTVGSERYASHFAQHACSHPMEMMMGFLSLVEGGVLENFPNLKFVFMEGGAGWLPFWLHRLDTVSYDNFGDEVSDNVVLKPSEYFKRQCYVTLEAGEPCMPQLADWLGLDCILFGSDYPHPDHLEKSLSGAVMECPGVTEEMAQRIVSNNPMELLQTNFIHA